MTKEFADKLAQPYLATAETLCVMSDGGVYINNDIEVMKQNALDRNTKIFIYKENVSIAEEVIEEKKSKKKQS
jgi:hypothetical protein